ncbi:hypothetical protein GE21DRAFT_1312404 [Neurospora crassa]|nr:related to arabinogalactan protein [imported] - Neurospora crassa [Neurospora crassa]KHE80094.1 hypothetical protein GE21DRAFT_1312404 [Neurospora crassa]
MTVVQMTSVEHAADIQGHTYLRGPSSSRFGCRGPLVSLPATARVTIHFVPRGAVQPPPPHRLSSKELDPCHKNRANKRTSMELSKLHFHELQTVSPVAATKTDAVSGLARAPVPVPFRAAEASSTENIRIDLRSLAGVLTLLNPDCTNYASTPVMNLGVETWPPNAARCSPPTVPPRFVAC